MRQRVDHNEDRLEQTVERVDYLETSVEADKTKNILMFVDQSERQDFSCNQSKSHCVLITGEFQKLVHYCNDMLSYKGKFILYRIKASRISIRSSKTKHEGYRDHKGDDKQSFGE